MREVDRPLSVLYRPDGPSVAELAGAGVARLSVGGSLFYVAMGALAAAAEALRADRAGYGASLTAGLRGGEGGRFSGLTGARQHVTSRGGTMPSVFSAGAPGIGTTVVCRRIGSGGGVVARRRARRSSSSVIAGGVVGRGRRARRPSVVVEPSVCAGPSPSDDLAAEEVEDLLHVVAARARARAPGRR